MRISVLSMFTAFAIVLSYIESFIPVVGIPGVKPGIANLAIVMVLYFLGTREAALVNGMRILIVGFLFGNLFSIVYSIAGAGCSLVVMAILKKTGKFHVPAISVAGGVFHNLGQLAVAAFVVETYSVFYYASVLMVSGVVTGIGIGVVADIIIKRTGGFVEKSIRKE